MNESAVLPLKSIGISGRNTKSDRSIDYYFLVMLSLLSIVNTVFAYNQVVSLVIVLAELLYLVFQVFTKNWFKYGCAYIALTITSLEFSDYYGNEAVYGFRETRLFGIGISTIALIPLLVVALLYIFSSKPLSINSPLTKLVKIILFLSVVAFFIGLMNIVFNNNNVRSLSNVWASFFNEVYNFVILLIAPTISFFYLIHRYWDKRDRLSMVLFASMVGVIFAQLFSFLTPFKGSIWESPTLLVSFASFYSPLVFCFSFYYTKKSDRLFTMIVGIIGMLLSTIYSVTSGGILVLFLVPLFSIIILFAKRQYSTILLFVFLTAVIAFVIFGVALATSSSVLFEYKMNQALSLVQFWKPNWIENLPRSAKFRFGELSNIIAEYTNNPLYLFFGKGIMGTCKDYNNVFYETHYMDTGSAFTASEWKNGVFFSMHESINVLLLSSGLFGILFLFSVVAICISRIRKSPFLTVGCVYLLFHFTYSFTASTLGLASLLIGFSYIGRNCYGDKNIKE